MPAETKQKPPRVRKRIRTGTKHRLQAPLPPPDAFRCAHWLATMVFVNLEKGHEGSLGSWAKGFWHKFNNYTWEETVVAKGSGAGASLAISLSSFAVITAVGTVLGGPLGLIIGAVIGAVFSTASGLVSLAINSIVGLAYHKLTREKVDDRLNRADHRERSGGSPDSAMSSGGYYYKIKEPVSLHQIMDQLDVSVWEIWEHKRNANIKSYIEGKFTDQTPATEVPIPKGKKIWIPAERDDDPKVGDFRHESRKLTRLVQHSLRDAVVHLRKAVAIYQEMPERMTGGRYYTPGEKEDYFQALANVRKEYPKFDFLDDAPLYCFRNKCTLHKRSVKPGETLEQMAEAEDCPWNDILEYVENHNLRSFYLNNKLWPERKEVRQTPIKGVRTVWVPVGIIPKVSTDRVSIYEYDGDLSVQVSTWNHYLPAGESIWIPAAKTLTRSKFKSCDEMVDQVQIALEFIHHLNKFRNYLLPCLNLCRLYLDVYEEFATFREHAHAVIEDAVLEYMQFGNHDGCNMWGEWQTLQDNWEKAKHKDWKNWKYWLFGSRYTLNEYRCMRQAWREAIKESGKAKDYTVGGDDETFDKIAAKHKIPVRTLIAHNYRTGKIAPTVVRYKAKDQKWDIKRATPGAGTTLSIPGSSWPDRLVYSDVWGRLKISPEQSTGGFEGDYSTNNAAQVSVAEVPVDDLKKELDEMVENYHGRLGKNRETHQKSWHEAPHDTRRYFWMMQDVLHGLDMPDSLTRIRHKFSNLHLRYTKGEKIVASLDVMTGLAGSALCSAISSGAGAGAAAPIFKAGAMDALKDLLLDKPGEDFLKYVGQSTIKVLGHSPKLAKLLVGLAITEGGGKLSGDESKEAVTEAHRLNFRKERIAVAAQLTDLKGSDRDQMSLKHASKITDDLFMKISRHAHWAFGKLQGDLVPMLGQLEKNSSEVGYGLKGCYDSTRHLRTLYEFQHQVDKTERYLVSALAFTKNLFDFEIYLSGIEEELREVLQKSAGKWIEEGDHSRCLKGEIRLKDKVVLSKRHCYGPDKKGTGKPRRPLRSRPKWDKPARPPTTGRKKKSEL
jgi:hypothetical protein